MLTEQEVEEAEANDADLELISYMEPPVREFKNALTWIAIGVNN